MRTIECKIVLNTALDADDDVLQSEVSKKRVSREGIEEFFRTFLENQVKPELGDAYRVPAQIPVDSGDVPLNSVAVMKVWLPEHNEALRHKLTTMLLQDIKSRFGEYAEDYSVLIDFQAITA